MYCFTGSNKLSEYSYTCTIIYIYVYKILNFKSKLILNSKIHQISTSVRRLQFSNIHILPVKHGSY